ncbi:MAG: ROK family protein [Acidimicrobiia bacterium]|nr:ROK family protein [Acidimicrobiia bacterium]
MQLFGIDIGGTGIKGAPVALDRGELAADRCRIDTPHPATPDSVAGVVAQIVDHFSSSDDSTDTADAAAPERTAPVGCTFPAVVKDGVALTAANVDDAWLGTDIASVFANACGRPFVVLNDADAAGIAEMRFGAGRGLTGVVAVITLGTGIGSALFVDGILVPNTELGHLEMDGEDAELQAAAKVREKEDLSWKKWAKRVDTYIEELDRLVWPDRIIIGGGVSKHADKFLPRIHTRAEVVPATLHNEAGIVGAALAAADWQASRQS